MKIKLIVFLLTFLFAGGILLISLFSSSSLQYEFKLESEGVSSATSLPSISYHLPFPGRVQPTSLLWPLKAARDKLVLELTFDKLEKAKLSLLMADKRLVSARILVEQEKYEEAAEVFKKSQMYLNYSYQLTQQADRDGERVSFAFVLALASLKHREVLEKSIIQFPEDARPVINEIMDVSKQVFEKISQLLNESGAKVPINPFDQ